MPTETRLDYAEFSSLAPAARAALVALSKAVNESGLDKQLIELVKIRASQINGCTFCVQFHLNDARKENISQTKLDLLAVWHDAPAFTSQERAALAWTETLTHPTPAGISDDAYQGAAKQFNRSELASLTSAIALINAWNRIAMAFCFAPPIPQHEAQG